MSWLTSATRSNSCTMLESSVWLLLRKRRLAGTLKKRFSTRKLLPSGQPSVSCESTLPPSMSMRVPSSVPLARVRSVTCATAAMLGKASPRKPMVRSEKRSEASRILLVACLSKAMRASVSLIPLPLSTTCMEERPASVISTSMRVAPASTAFSTSSFTTEEGRCITSPAAIWLATESGSSLIMSAMSFPRKVSCL